MNARIRRTTGLVSAAVMLPLALSACSGSDSDSAKSDSKASASASAPESSAGMSSMDQPFGPACSSVPKSGAGSFDGMAKDPVATA
ncbi:fasciclin domain-containing protein, partial [Streptomyces griseoluteus]